MPSARLPGDGARFRSEHRTVTVAVSRGQSSSAAPAGGAAAAAGPGVEFLTPAPGSATAPAGVVDPANLHRTARALLGEGFRLALVAVRRDAEASVTHVSYLFTAGRPDRRIEIAVPIDRLDRTIPSLARLALPAGRFEAELYELHGIVAGSSRPAPGSVPTAIQQLDLRSAGRRISTVLPRIERVVPDSGVSHALAYCLAVEDALHWTVPRQVSALRAILLELERLHSQVRALGALWSHAGLPGHAGEARALHRLLLRINQETSGHRLLRGAVGPGRVSVQHLPSTSQLRAIGSAVSALQESALADPAVHACFRHASMLTPEHAAVTGALGFVARASGINIDARRDHPFHPATTTVPGTTTTDGDALARMESQGQDVDAAIALLCRLIPETTPVHFAAPPPEAASPEALPAGTLRGVGIVEGWRGTVVHRVELAPDGRLINVKAVDPSFLNTPALNLAQTAE